MAYGVDSGAVMAASVFMTIMTKMVWSQGGHIKRRLLYCDLRRDQGRSRAETRMLEIAEG